MAEGGEHGVVHGLAVVAEHVVDPVVLCLRAAAGGVVAGYFGVVGEEVGRHVVAAIGVVMDYEALRLFRLEIGHFAGDADGKSAYEIDVRRQLQQG